MISKKDLQIIKKLRDIIANTDDEICGGYDVKMNSDECSSYSYDDKPRCTLCKFDATVRKLFDENPVWWKGKRPFPDHKTLAEKHCECKYEDCVYKYTCENGEECWFDSEDYWYDCGQGAPTVEECVILQEIQKILDRQRGNND